MQNFNFAYVYGFETSSLRVGVEYSHVVFCERC